MRARSLVPLVALLMHPMSVHASSAVLLPDVGGDEAVAMETRLQARELAAQVLEAERWAVLDALQVTPALPEALARCGPREGCAFELRALLDADVAIGLELFGSGASVERVRVTLTGARGVTHAAEATVDPEAGLPFAVAEPLRETLQRWASGVAPAPDLAVAIETVEHEDPMRVEPSPLNYFLGVFLVLGSAPLLGYGINSAVRDGECIEAGPLGSCTERVRFQEGAGIFAGLGAAVLLAGVVTLIARPIPMFVEVSPQSARLELRGSF